MPRVSIGAVAIGAGLVVACSGSFRSEAPSDGDGELPPRTTRATSPLPDAGPPNTDATATGPNDSGASTSGPETRTVTVRFQSIDVGEDGSFGVGGFYEWAQWRLWARCRDQAVWVLPDQWIKSPTGRLHPAVAVTFRATADESFSCDAGGSYWTQANSNPDGYPIPPASASVRAQLGNQKVRVSGRNDANGVNYDLDLDVEVTEAR